MCVLWLKMMELQFMERSLGYRPILLLDDIFSELDDTHDQLAMDLATKQQTIVTATEISKDLRDKVAEVIDIG